MSKYTYGEASQKRLDTCDPRLQLVMRAVLEMDMMDVMIVEGVRDKEKQNEFFKTGKSKLQWPNGKHNVVNAGDKAKALDAAPYINDKISWDSKHCCFLAGMVLAIGKALGIKIRWGGNWDMDGEPVTDQSFQDLVHYELVD